MISDKAAIGTVGILVLGILQCMAWYTGHNGAVFALTSAGIGGIIGSTFNLRDLLNKLK